MRTTDETPYSPPDTMELAATRNMAKTVSIASSIFIPVAVLVIDYPGWISFATLLVGPVLGGSIWGIGKRRFAHSVFCGVLTITSLVVCTVIHAAVFGMNGGQCKNHILKRMALVRCLVKSEGRPWVSSQVLNARSTRFGSWVPAASTA